jgi:hypothetical protein
LLPDHQRGDATAAVPDITNFAERSSDADHSCIHWKKAMKTYENEGASLNEFVVPLFLNCQLVGLWEGNVHALYGNTRWTADVTMNYFSWQEYDFMKPPSPKVPFLYKEHLDLSVHIVECFCYDGGYDQQLSSEVSSSVLAAINEPWCNSTLFWRMYEKSSE